MVEERLTRMILPVDQLAAPDVAHPGQLFAVMSRSSVDEGGLDMARS